MPLKVKRAGADEYGRTLKLLLAGDPGAGKTRMSSTFPHPFYANVEGGLMSVADRQVPFVDITASEDLLALLEALRQTPKARESVLGVPVSTVIIDTLDAVQKLLIDERKRTEKKESMAIADWGWLGDQLRLMVRNYRNLDLNVIFTCHVKTESDAETGQTFVKPGLQGAMGDEIAAYVDIAGLLKASPKTVVTDGKTTKVLARILQTSPDLRHPWLKDRSGRLAVETEVNLVNDGTALLGCIYGKPVVASSTPAPAPAPAPKAAARPEPEPIPAEEVPDSVPEIVSVPETEPEVDSPPEASSHLTLVPQTLNQEPPAPETEEPAAATEEAVHTAPSPDMVCADCGGIEETEDQRDLSKIRFRRPLCHSCFKTAKANKK